MTHRLFYWQFCGYEAQLWVRIYSMPNTAPGTFAGMSAPVLINDLSFAHGLHILEILRQREHKIVRM